MLDIKEIELVFENCESMTVPRNVIGQFDVEDVCTHIHRVAANAISKYQVANKIAIEIFSEFDSEYFPFDVHDEDWKDSRFHRIVTCNDITSIEVVYQDDTRDIFYADFDGEYDNANQKSMISSLGNLYIVIGKDMSMSNIFSDEYVEDKEAVQLRKNLFDIGIEEEKYHPFTEDSLPDLYRYVYLEDERNSCLAIRVEDQNSGWRFVYEESDRVVHFPVKWMYPKSNIVSFLDVHNKEKGFTVEQIKQKYPPIAECSIE